MAFKYDKLKIGEKKQTGIYVFISIFALVLFLIMASVIPFLKTAKNIPSADLLLCLVCALSAFLPAKKACIFALVFGLFADLFLFMPTAFSPLVYMAAVLVTQLFYSRFSRLGSVVMAVCSIPALAVRCVLETVVTSVLFKDASFGRLLLEFSLPLMTVNFAWSIVICFVCRKLILRFGLN